MQQIVNLWVAMTGRHRIIVIVATAAMFAAVLAMSRIASNPTLTLLYSGLESSAAGDVVRALEQRDVAFEVRGGSIFVDSAHRDELRLTLASEGLPANNGQGYELLDSLSGFGTTSQMFDAAYWRAKEGELARTIVSNSHINMARVHIANSGSNPFQRNVTPTASVLITPTGGSITPAQAKALRYLVASAVAGLSPDDVSIIDGNGSLIGSVDETAPISGAEDKAQFLRDRVQRLLEARVGPGNAVVEVSVETVTESESIRERHFDPEGRVAISTDTQESSTSANDAGSGDVTVASNLPDGDGAQGENSSSQNSETREQVNYEVSETERNIVRAPGAVKRLTVAVLVNGSTEIDASGTEAFVPRSEEEMSALRELVSATVGFDEARGDVITLKSMALQSVTPIGTVAATSFLDGIHIDLMSIIQMLVLAFVTLVLGLFVLRPILAKPPALPAPDRGALPATLPSSPVQTQDASLTALTGEIEDDGFDGSAVANVSALGDFGAPAAAAGIGAPFELGADPVDRLRTMIGDRQEETVEILRGWLEDREESV